MLKAKQWGVALLILLSAPFSWAEDGVTEKEILIGMSNAQATSENARMLREGATVYFNRVNAAGGIQGRRIKLIVYDDAYQPLKAVENTRKFIEEDKVFALFGYLGSPNSARSEEHTSELQSRGHLV